MTRAWLLAVIVACHHADHSFHQPAKPGTVVALCAAYPYEPQTTHAVVIDPSGSPGEVVTFHDHAYNIHRNDCLRFDDHDLDLVRWIDHDAYLGIGVRGAAADRLEDRSTKRMSQYDAVFIGDTLIAIPLYQDVMHDALWVANAQRALFAQLTGVDPPARGAD